MKRWEKRLAPWSEQARNFRAEGFYERFPAKGQVERVGPVVDRDCGRKKDVEHAGDLGPIGPHVAADALARVRVEDDER